MTKVIGSSHPGIAKNRLKNQQSLLPLLHLYQIPEEFEACGLPGHHHSRRHHRCRGGCGGCARQAVKIRENETGSRPRARLRDVQAEAREDGRRPHLLDSSRVPQERARRPERRVRGLLA